MKAEQETNKLVDMKKSHPSATNRFFAGIKYKCSTGINGEITRGYGYLDDYGFWQYPLYFQE